MTKMQKVSRLIEPLLILPAKESLTRLYISQARIL